MGRMNGLAAIVGVAVLMVVVAGCSSGESSTIRDTSSSASPVENASGNTVSPQAPNEPDTEPDVVRQDESAALGVERMSVVTDTALTANQTGLPVESVERAMAFQKAFGKYVDELIVRFPDQISAVWMEPMPNARGHVQFTGEVPQEVTSEIEWQASRPSVDGSPRRLLDPNNVILIGEGMISMADNSRRAELAAEALVDLGYQNFITLFDPIDNVINIELLLPEGASQPSKLDLVGAVQNRVRAERHQGGEARFQGRAATVDALDLELTVITGSGPIMELEPAEAEPVSDVLLAQGQPGPYGSPGANTSAVIPEGTPALHGAPRLNLTYEGAVYYASALSDDDAANLNENNLELVGAATESNLLRPSGSEIRRFIVDLSHDNPELAFSEIKERVEAKFQIGLDNSTVGRTLKGLDIYKPKDGEEGYVYTFMPGHSMVNPEDGQIFEFPPEWMRWAAAD